MTHKRNGPRNVPRKPFGRDVLPVAWIHDVVNCCLLGRVARRGTEESVFRNKTRKHTSKWRRTRTSSVYFPMIPIPYRFVPEVVGLHVPSCPSLNFISPTEAWDPAWFWPDYCTRKLRNEAFFWGKPQILKNEATITCNQPKKPCAPEKIAGSLHFGKNISKVRRIILSTKGVWYIQSLLSNIDLRRKVPTKFMQIGPAQRFKHAESTSRFLTSEKFVLSM